MLGSLFRGVWIGFCIAAPVGPIGILVLKQALQAGVWSGLANGFGAALADLAYGCVAVAGVRLAAGPAQAVAVVGGIILLWLAYRSWSETPAGDAGLKQSKSRLSGTATTFVLTLSNPMTILSFAALVASVGANAPMYFVGGVFLGSMLWWVILSLAAGRLAGILKLRSLVLNRVAAVTLACFGIWAIWTHI